MKLPGATTDFCFTAREFAEHLGLDAKQLEELKASTRACLGPEFEAYVPPGILSCTYDGKEFYLSWVTIKGLRKQWDAILTQKLFANKKLTDTEKDSFFFHFWPGWLTHLNRRLNTHGKSRPERHESLKRKRMPGWHDLVLKIVMKSTTPENGAVITVPISRLVDPKKRAPGVEMNALDSSLLRIKLLEKPIQESLENMGFRLPEWSICYHAKSGMTMLANDAKHLCQIIYQWDRERRNENDGMIWLHMSSKTEQGHENLMKIHRVLDTIKKELEVLK